MKNGLEMKENIVPYCVSIFSIFFIILFSTSMNDIYAQEEPFQEPFEEPLDDITAPVIIVPSDLTVSAIDFSGSIVTFSATASDDIDGFVSTTCFPLSSSVFPIGSTTVFCTATDSAGNVGFASFVITVQDSTAPVVTVPGDFTVSAMSLFGSSVPFSVSALDDIDGVLNTTCTPPSRSTFAIGSTTVTCTATDSAGNIGSASFVISVQDSTPPVVTVPEDLIISTTLTSKNSVTFSASASDDIDGFISTRCFPFSDSVFPIGRTTVICSATDSAGNVGSASFVITVQNMITIVQEELVALQETNPQEIGSIGDEISRFVHTANSLFELEKQGLKDLQNKFRQDLKNSSPTSTKDLRKAFNSDLSDFRNQFQDFRKQYHDIFKEFRHDVKQLAKDSKELTMSDRKQLHQLEKNQIKNSEPRGQVKLRYFYSGFN